MYKTIVGSIKDVSMGVLMADDFQYRRTTAGELHKKYPESVEAIKKMTEAEKYRIHPCFELTPNERARWKAFKAAYNREKEKPERVKKIIEMSAAGASIKEIRTEVGGALEVIGYIRRKGRRDGMW